MKTLVKQLNNLIPKKKTNSSATKQPKIRLGTGRLMAEIDYDAVFGNVVKK